MARTTILEKFYNSNAWKKSVKHKQLSAAYKCEICGGIGEIVHHKIPLTDANVNDLKISLNQDNLQLVCRNCHKKIHDELKGKSKWIEFDEQGNIIPF